MKKNRRSNSGLVKASNVSLEGLGNLFKQQVPALPEAQQTVRGDFNLSRLPYFAVGDKKADRFRDLYLEEEIEKADTVIKAIWEVRHDTKLGLPGSFDRDVWLGILEIINDVTQNGAAACPEIIDIGTARNFLQRLGKSGNGGKDIAMLKESIERMAQTMCVSRKSFNCPDAGGYLGEVFQLIRGWGFIGQPDGNGGIYEKNFIKLDSFIRKNLDSGYIALIDVKYMRSLRTEIAKQLYQLLSYKFWQAGKNGRSYWSVKWQHLANYLGITSWDNLRLAKKRLKPALIELQEQAYITDWEWDGDRLVLFAGDKYIQEHSARVAAWDSYQRNHSVKQPSKTLTKQISSQPNLLIPLAARWAAGYDPSLKELSDRNCTLDDLECVAKAEGIPIARN